MNVKVLYFAALRDLFGRGEEWVSLPEGENLRGLALNLCARHPKLEGQLKSLAWGVNFEYAGMETGLNQGDEVALLPPVSGGLA